MTDAVRQPAVPAFTGPYDGPVCAVCGSSLPGSVRVRLARARLTECEQCGTWNYLPRPCRDEQLALHDSPEYFDHPYFGLRRAAHARLQRRCREAFRRLSSGTDLAHLRGQRLLDIGCDTRQFLQCAAEVFGIIPVGIDVSARAVNAAADRGIEVYRTDIENAPEFLRGFPVITAIDLIEHVADPFRFLCEVGTRLKPGGLLYIETPNVRSGVYALGSRLCNLTHGRPLVLFDRLFPPHHIQYFSSRALTGLARAAGFQILRADTRALPRGDIAAPGPVRTALGALQLLDRLRRRQILICLVLRWPGP